MLDTDCACQSGGAGGRGPCLTMTTGEGGGQNHRGQHLPQRPDAHAPCGVAWQLRRGGDGLVAGNTHKQTVCAWVVVLVDGVWFQAVPLKGAAACAVGVVDVSVGAARRHCVVVCGGPHVDWAGRCYFGGRRRVLLCCLRSAVCSVGSPRRHALTCDCGAAWQSTRVWCWCWRLCWSSRLWWQACLWYICRVCGGGPLLGRAARGLGLIGPTSLASAGCRPLCRPAANPIPLCVAAAGCVVCCCCAVRVSGACAV